jgi:competence protein ComGC
MSLKAPRKDKITLPELIIIVLLIGVLMTSFLMYFFKHQGQVTQTGFNNVSYVFAARLNAMRAKWMMSGQPRFIFVDDETSSTQMKVSLNSKGWVENSASVAGCKSTWLQIMGSSIDNQESNILAIWLALNSTNTVQKSLCRYSLSGGEYFNYTPSNGKVTEVQLAQ